MAQRKRKRRPTQPRPRPKAEQRNEAVRATLTPYSPGERPRAIVISCVFALAIAASNIGFLAAGARFGGRHASPGTTILFAVLMLAAAVGMWQLRYWAVLGFEALLAITVVIAAIALTVADNIAAVALCVVLIGVAGTLFWKLVRVMARIQMPARRPG